MVTGAVPRGLPFALGVVSLLAVATAGGGSMAFGDSADAAKAEELIRQANEQRRQGHDERAVPLLRKAYEIARSARTAGQLGLAEMALGYWTTAAGHLGEALAEERNPWIEKNRATLEKEQHFVESHVAEIRVEGKPDGAEVVVNGIVAGTLPLASPLRVNEGQVIVEVRAPGRRPMTTTLSLAGRARETLTVALAPEAAPATPSRSPNVAPPPLPSPAPNDDKNPTASEPGGAAPDRTRDAPIEGGELSPWRRVLAWSLLGGAVAAGAVAVWQGVDARTTQRWFDEIGACGSDDPMRGTDPRCGGLYSDFQTYRTRAYIGWGLAGALAAGATTLFILNAMNVTVGSAARSDSGHVAVAFGPTGTMLSYGARF